MTMYVHSNVIPTTREEALAAIAEQDARRWGEAERAPSRLLNRSLSFGRLLNALAARATLDDAPIALALHQAADAAMTAADRAELRQGG